MHNVTTSRHIRTSTELMIMVPIKTDFVPITELVMSYATRISVVLQALAEIRQLKLERGFGTPVGPIEQLGMIYRVQWTVIEPFDDVKTSDGSVTAQMMGPQVVLTSHFDASWENYFRELVTVGKPLLDLIFSHCQDYEGFSCDDGYEAFASFIRRHQRRCDFLYATAPEVTIDDIRYHVRYSMGGGVTANAPAAAVLPELVEAKQIILEQLRVDEHDDRTRGALRAIQGLHDVRQHLFLDAGGIQSGRTKRSDRALFDAAVVSTLELEPDLYRLNTALAAVTKRGKPPASELAAAARWMEDIFKIYARVNPADFQKPPQTPLQLAAAGVDSRDPRPELGADKQIADLLADIQGNVLTGYPSKVEAAKLVLLRCKDEAGLRELISWTRTKFTSEADSRKPDLPPLLINVGITYHGLKLLDLPPTVMEALPREFCEGMEERAGVVGDVAYNHPKNWKLPLRPDAAERVHLSSVHLALVLLGSKAEVDKAFEELQPNDIAHVLDLNPSGKDELSQPLPHGRLQRDPLGQASALDIQALGEFIVGYKDNAGATADLSKSGDEALFKNGCFMAMRKMQKDDLALSAYVESVADKIINGHNPSKDDREELKLDVEALILGRRSDGRMLGNIQTASGANLNNFDYSSDPDGKVCPFGSHVRRANPRIGKVPRIARRGIPYAEGPNALEQKESGLLFMAYCASLATQYEVVQGWVNGGNSTGLLSTQNDMVFGSPLGAGPRVVSLAGSKVSMQLGAPQTLSLPAPQTPFVSLRWGMYLFMPSLNGLARLCKPHPQPEAEAARDKAAIARGEAIIKQLDALPTAVRTYEWKRILEEVPEGDSAAALHALDVAQAITINRKGAHRFKAQIESRDVDVVVVTTADLAKKVLSNSDQFSVSEYRSRMSEALLDHYLGYDVCDFDKETKLTYDEFSKQTNETLAKLGPIAQELRDAYKFAAALLANPDDLELDPDGRGGPDTKVRSTISVKDLSMAVIGKLCHLWLNMPGKGAAQNPGAEPTTRSLMDAVERLLIASRYCFQAMPVAYLRQQAKANQSAIIDDYYSVPIASSKIAQAIQSQLKPAAQYSLSSEPTPNIPDDDVLRLSITALLGAVGFAPPAVGAATRILDYWIENEKLWQIQHAYASMPHGRPRDQFLVQEAIEALSKAPAPPTLYRTATANATALGDIKDIAKGTIVIVNLGAAYRDAAPDEMPYKWFFGGDNAAFTPGEPQHGCPGRQAGLLAILQIIEAVLERQNLRRERRFLLSYDR